MAYEENLRSLTLEADASVGIFTGPPGVTGSAVPNTGMQYRFVKVVGADTCGLATAATDVTCGVLQNKPQQPGAAATVGYEGVTFLMSGGVVSAGNLLAPDGTGRAVVDAVNGRWQALRPAAAAGVLIPAFRVK
ncbi:MAG: hypothetical protein ABIO67_04025 [Mycobacteriales bacterium]